MDAGVTDMGTADMGNPDMGPILDCSVCDANATCDTSSGSVVCTCNSGYQGNGFTCIQIGTGCSPACGTNAFCNTSTACECNVGYEGDPLTACTLIDQCTPNPCQNGGLCDSPIPGTYNCTCMTGFDGMDCAHNIDDCAGITCQNGGTCVDGVNTFTCNCVTGYDGMLCENNIDDCAGVTCQNGGTCVDGIASFSCSCVTGYTGMLCETDINECASNPCQNGATCVDQVGSYSCTCQLGYDGINCENNVNDCAVNPCANGGTCIDGVASFTCDCATAPGYDGATCTNNIDDCASNPCQNGGTCVDGVNMYGCTCQPGFTGSNCETNIDECMPNPCQNGGVCTDGVNSFSCACTGGYTGSDCSTYVAACASNPCANGQCSDAGGGTYSCTCDAGWTGTNCDQDIDECATNNGGCDALSTCTNNVGAAPTCGACPSGYSGTGATGCADIDECATNNGGCDALTSCTNNLGAAPTCGACPSGYSGTGATGCTDIDECATNNGGCDALSTCTNNAGAAPTCGACPSGYTGTGATGCVDINECTTNNGGCDPLTLCTNNAGAAPTCGACPSGYTGTGATGCTDIDECATNNGGCDALTTCTNNAGATPTCGACPSGYTGTGATGCTDINECATNNGGCDALTSCTNNAGAAPTCGACPSGYTGTGATGCTDINECATNNGGCDPLSLCTNNAGAAPTCGACPSGYTGTGATGCTDIDECATNNGGCDALTTCTNNAGAAPTCGACPTGYSGTGATGCVNIDDCASAPCQNGATCTDGIATYTCACTTGWSGPNCNVNADDCIGNACQNGSTCIDGLATYSCSCPAGYTGTHCETVVLGCSSNPCANGACTDTGGGTYSCACNSGWQGVNCDTPINLCTSSNPCQNGSACSYTGPGTYSCACTTGWTGTNCQTDIDECATNNGGCDALTTCTNNAGAAPTCGACPSGYSGTGATGCTDIDECLTANGGCSANANCANTLGSRTCTCNTGYTGDGITCSAVDCGGAPAVANATGATISGGAGGGSTTTLGATAVYACATGFAKNGSDATCLVTGLWSAPPTCDVVASYCPAAPTVLNAATPVIGGGLGGAGTTSLNATAVYTCDAGYSKSGSDAVCQADQTWTAAPSCDAIAAYCPALTDPANGTVVVAGGAAGGTTTSLNATATYTCGTGYVLSGTSPRTCGVGGSWSGVAPSCVPVSCGGAPAVNNAGAPTVSGGNGGGTTTTYGATAAYTCLAGYTKNGSDATCQLNGTWTAAPTCTPTASLCPAAPTVANASSVVVSGGAAGGTTTSLGATAAYTCAVGYTKGGSDATCQSSGLWTTPPTCTANATFCPAPPTVNNSSGATLTGGAAGNGTTSLGATAAYTCNDGYTKGGIDSTCLSSASWSVAPTCTATSTYCPAVSAPTNGSVTVSGGLAGTNTTSLGATAAYSCGSGFNLVGSNNAFCQSGGSWSSVAPTCQDIDECAGFPCQNGGTCTNTTGSYTCSCPAGWTGVNCQTNVNECATGNPCLEDTVAGITCTDTAGSYTCSCGTFYQASGGTCVDVDECAVNNGNCGTGYSCTNNIGAAPTCTAINCGAPPAVTNAGSPAVSGGSGGGSTTTFGATATYTCNGGYMLSGSNPTCQSSGSWSAAPSCVDINECSAGNPCLEDTYAVNGCTNSTGGYTCSCGTGFAGAGSGLTATCADVNECLTGNGGCNANATCTNTIGGRTCACNAATGWGGDGITCTQTYCTLTYNLGGTVQVADTTLGAGDATNNVGGTVAADTGTLIMTARSNPVTHQMINGGDVHVRYLKWYQAFAISSAGLTVTTRVTSSVNGVLNNYGSITALMDNCSLSNIDTSTNCGNPRPLVSMSTTLTDANSGTINTGTGAITWGTCTRTDGDTAYQYAPRGSTSGNTTYTPANSTTGPGCLVNFRNTGLIYCNDGALFANCSDGNLVNNTNWQRGTRSATPVASDTMWNQPLNTVTIAAGTPAVGSNITMARIQVPNNAPSRSYHTWSGTLNSISCP